MAGRRADETAGRRDDEIAGRRDNGTTRRRDNGTTGPRDHGTTRPRDRGTAGLQDCKTAEKHRRSQAFPGVLSRAWLCVAARGSLASEWCRCGASQKRVPRDSTKTYSPWYFTFRDVPQMRRYHVKLLSQKLNFCQKGAECYTRQKCRRWVVLERTSH